MRVRILGHHVNSNVLLLAVAEAAVIFAAPFAASWIRFQETLGQLEEEWIGSSLIPRATVFCVVAFCCLVAMGLYRAQQRARLTGILIRLITAFAAAFGITAVTSYLFPQLEVGRSVLALTACLSLAGSLSVRFIFDRMVDENRFKRRVLVLGVGKRATAISNLRRRSDQRGFTLAGYVPCDGDSMAVPAERVVDPGSTPLAVYSEDHEIDEIVIAMDDRRREFPLAELLECRLNGIEVTDLVNFLERETGKVTLDVINPSWFIFADGFRRDAVRLGSVRAFDIVVSLTLLIVTLPLTLLTILAIKLDDGMSAPVLYRQRRTGYNGKAFEVLKFRSMRTDAEKDGKAQWATKQDARVTRVGKIIRLTRIDEIPQVWNVLKGEMSLVGPRPERPEFVSQLNERVPYYSERHRVKPGLTGWAQLCYPYGSSEHDAKEKLQYDLFYVKNHSLLFDLAILLQTAEVVLWGRGAR